MGNTFSKFPFHGSSVRFSLKESRNLLSVAQSSSLSHSATACPPSIYPEKEMVYHQTQVLEF